MFKVNLLSKLNRKSKTKMEDGESKIIVFTSTVLAIRDAPFAKIPPSSAFSVKPLVKITLRSALVRKINMRTRMEIAKVNNFLLLLNLN